METGHRGEASGYAIAVVAVVATVLIDAVLMRAMGARAPIIALLLPVIVAAVFGGVGPGLLATIMGAVLAVASILPASGWSVPPLDAARAFLFLIEGSLASWLIGSRRRAFEAERRAVRDRSESETRYRELVESVNSVILRWRHDGIVTFANEYAQTLFGYRADELVGKHVGLLLPTSDSAGSDLSELVADVVAHPERYRQSVNENLSRDGRRIWVLWTNRPLFDEEGNVVEILAIGSDITKLKEAEEALRDADRRKNEFLAVLGHELRNPLAPLRTGLEVLAQAGAGVEHRAVLAMMQRQLAYIVHLVDDLLDLARLSRGKLDIRLEDIDLRDVIDAATELIRPRIDERGHKLIVERTEAALPVQGDFHRLTQVLANVLDNAAKYTEPGGSIRLKAEAERGTIVVRVRDTGSGIPAEQLDTVFEMFSQVRGNRLRRGGGDLGIGLAVSRQLCTLHGGSIEAKSDGIGLGAEFIVRLQMRVPAVAPVHDGGEEDPLAPRRRILVVDDNADAAETLRFVLQARGHIIEIANDGIGALKAIRQFGPDVVVLDIGLPDMDGYEVAKRIRESRDGRKIVLIALTGWGQPEDKQRAWEAGFDEHLTKPVRSSLLATLIAARSSLAGSGSDA